MNPFLDIAISHAMDSGDLQAALRLAKAEEPGEGLIAIALSEHAPPKVIPVPEGRTTTGGRLFKNLFILVLNQRIIDRLQHSLTGERNIREILFGVED
jgi:hypothetical protein